MSICPSGGGFGGIRKKAGGKALQYKKMIQSADVFRPKFISTKAAKTLLAGKSPDDYTFFFLLIARFC